MGKLVVAEFLTLDGVMQGPGGEEEDRSGGFDRGGWQRPYYDEVFGKTVTEGIAKADAYLLGRRTYDIFAAYWPTAQPEDQSIAGPLNSRPKHVVSRTLKEPLPWNNSTLIKGDIAEGVAAIRNQPGKNIMLMGSGELAQILMKEDLVDEYSLMFHPLVLGKGRKLFREGGRLQTLNLVGSTTTSKGVLMATYRPARE